MSKVVTLDFHKLHNIRQNPASHKNWVLHSRAGSNQQPPADPGYRCLSILQAAVAICRRGAAAAAAAAVARPVESAMTTARRMAPPR